MAKKITAYIKLQVKAAQANPSPPVGPALGQHGVNIMEFCKAFNARTQGMEPGLPTPPFGPNPCAWKVFLRLANAICLTVLRTSCLLDFNLPNFAVLKYGGYP